MQMAKARGVSLVLPNQGPWFLLRHMRHDRTAIGKWTDNSSAAATESAKRHKITMDIYHSMAEMK